MSMGLGNSGRTGGCRDSQVLTALGNLSRAPGQ
jgi:hypothetical protein